MGHTFSGLGEGGLWSLIFFPTAPFRGRSLKISVINQRKYSMMNVSTLHEYEYPLPRSSYFCFQYSSSLLRR